MNNTVQSLSDEVSHLTHKGLDGLTSAGHQAGDFLQHTAHEALALSQRGMQALRSNGHDLQDRAKHAQQITASYIQNEPIKAVLMAAAAGATLMGLISLLTRRSDRGHRNRGT
jgi:ElaB/YqjD/DUF883 family membrane-anchored ribosome-binding protein